MSIWAPIVSPATLATFTLVAPARAPATSPVVVAAVPTAVAIRTLAASPEPIRIGAVYPLSGSQGPGGIEEFRGVELAAKLANQSGGVGGRPIQLGYVRD